MAGENENPVEAGQFLGDDGVFQENWRDHFSEEDADLKDDPTLANVKGVRAMARMLVDSEKKFGRDKVALLTDTSTDAEKAEHYTKLGRPESAEGYEFDKIQMPDGQKKNDKFIAKMEQSLFEGGASKALAQRLVKSYMEYNAEFAQAMDTEDKLGNAEANKQLHTLLGSAYDTKIASAKIAIEAIARPIDNDFAETLIKEMPYDVHAAQFLAKIGELIGEDKGLVSKPGETELLTPGDARAKANEVMANPYYTSEQPAARNDKGELIQQPRNAALHKQLIEEVSRLLTIANA